MNYAQRELRCRRHLRRRDVTNAQRRDQRRSVTYAERVTYALCVTYTPDVTYVCGVTYAGRDQRPVRDLRTGR